MAQMLVCQPLNCDHFAEHLIRCIASRNELWVFHNSINIKLTDDSGETNRQTIRWPLQMYSSIVSRLIDDGVLDGEVAWLFMLFGILYVHSRMLL